MKENKANQENTMHSYLVWYREPTWHPDDKPWACRFAADDSEHAVDQMLDYVPDAIVIEVVQECPDCGGDKRRCDAYRAPEPTGYTECAPPVNR